LTPADENPTTGLYARDVTQALAGMLAGSDPSDPLSTAASSTFQSLVASLDICANGARPDIAFATSMLQRCVSCPTHHLLDAAYRVLRYLRTETGLGIHYTLSATPLAGMSDSDWSIGRSTTGWAFLYGNAALSWRSVEQPSIALYTCEAEIMAASAASDEAILIDDRLRAFGRQSIGPISLSVDNMSARDLTYNPEHHDKTKHISAVHLRIRSLGLSSSHIA
jgi:hypothetical protein